MTIRRVDVPGLDPPVGLAHAVSATDRATVFLAGQVGVDEGGQPQDLATQFGVALDRLLIALRAAGGAPTDLTSMTVYTLSVADYRDQGRTLGQIWRAKVGRVYPAMAVIGVRELWFPAALIELQAMAAVARED